MQNTKYNQSSSDPEIPNHPKIVAFLNPNEQSNNFLLDSIQRLFPSKQQEQQLILCVSDALRNKNIDSARKHMSLFTNKYQGSLWAQQYQNFIQFLNIFSQQIQLMQTQKRSLNSPKQIKDHTYFGNSSQQAYKICVYHVCDALKDCQKLLINSNQQVWSSIEFLSKSLRRQFSKRNNQIRQIQNSQANKIIESISGILNLMMTQSISRSKTIEDQLWLKIQQCRKQCEVKRIQWENQKDSLTQSISQSQLLIDSLNKNLQFSDDIHKSLLRQIDHLKLHEQKSTQIANEMSPKLTKTLENRLQIQSSPNSIVFKLQKQVQSLRKDLIAAQSVIIQINQKEIQSNKISNQRQKNISALKSQNNLLAEKNKKLYDQNQNLRQQSQALRKRLSQITQLKEQLYSMNSQYASKQSKQSVFIENITKSINKSKSQQQLYQSVKAYKAKNPHSPMGVLIEKISQERVKLHNKIKQLEAKELQIIQYIGTILDIVQSQDQWLQETLKYLDSTKKSGIQELHILSKIFQCIQVKPSRQFGAQNSQYRQNKKHSKFLQVENQIKLLVKSLKNNEQNVINHCQQLWTNPQYLKNILHTQMCSNQQGSEGNHNFKAIELLKLQLQRYLSLLLVQFMSKQQRIKQQCQSKMKQSKRFYEGVISQFELQKDNFIQNIGRSQTMVETLKKQIKELENRNKNSYKQEKPIKQQSQYHQCMPTKSETNIDQEELRISNIKLKQLQAQFQKKLQQKQELLCKLRSQNLELEAKVQRVKKGHVQSIESINQKIRQNQQAVNEFLNLNKELSQKVELQKQNITYLQAQVCKFKQQNQHLKQLTTQKQSEQQQVRRIGKQQKYTQCALIQNLNQFQPIKIEESQQLLGYKQQIIALNQQLYRRTKETTQLEEKLSKKIQQNQDIYRQLQYRQSSQREKQKQDDKIAQIRKLNDLMKVKTDEISSLKRTISQLERLKFKNKALQESNNKLKRELNDLQEYQGIIEELKKKNQEMRREVEKFKIEREDLLLQIEQKDINLIRIKSDYQLSRHQVEQNSNLNASHIPNQLAIGRSPKKTKTMVSMFNPSKVTIFVPDQIDQSSEQNAWRFDMRNNTSMKQKIEVYEYEQQSIQSLRSTSKLQTLQLQKCRQEKDKQDQEIRTLSKKLTFALTELDQIRQGFPPHSYIDQQEEHRGINPQLQISFKISQYQRQLNILKNQAQDLKEQIQIYKNAINANENSFIQLRQENSDLKQLVSQYSQQINNLLSEKQEIYEKFISKQEIQRKIAEIQQIQNSQKLILADELMSLGQQTKSLKRELETANRKNFELDRIINQSEMANQIAYQKIQLLLIELQKYRQLRRSYSNKNTTQHFDELAVLGRQVQSLVNPNSDYSSSNKVNRQMRVSLEIQLLKKERQQVQKMLKQREGSPLKDSKSKKRGLDQMQSELVNDFQRFHNVQIDQTLRDEQSRIKYKQRQQQKQLIGKLKIMRSIEISSSEFQPPSHFDMDQISPRLENTQSVDNFGQQKCQSLLQQNQQLIREQKCLKSRLMFLQSKAQELQNSDQQQQILLVKYKDQLRNLKRQSECKYQSLLKQVAELSSENQELKKRKQQEHKIEFTSKRQKQSQNLHQKQLAIIQKQQKSLILLQNQQTFKEKQLFKRQNYIAKQKIKELNNLLFLKQQRYQTLNQQYLSTKQETDVLKHEIEKLQIQVQQMKRLIDGLNREKDKIIEEFYQKQRKKTYQGKQQSHSQLIMLQQQNRALRKEIQEQADTKFKQLKAMQNDKIQMAKKIRSQNLKIDQLQSKEKQYQIQISELRRQRFDDKENQRRISRQFEILMHEKGQIQRDVKRVQDSLGKANQKLSIQNSQLQKQLQNIYQNERQINKLIGLLKAKERDIQQLRDGNTRLQKQQKLIKAQNLRLKQQIEILNSSQGKLNRKVQSINLQLAQALNLNRAQFEQLNKRQMQIRHSKSQIVKLETRVSQTVDQLSSICRQKEQLKHQLSLKQAQAQRIKQVQKLYEKQFQVLKLTNQQLKMKIIEISSPISQNKLQLDQKYAQLDQKRKQMQIQKIKTIELEQQLKNKEKQQQKLRILIQQHKKSTSLQIGSLKVVIQDQNNVIKALDLGSKIYQRPTSVTNQMTILEHRNQIQLLKDNLKDQKQENDQNREQIRRLRLSLQQTKFKQSGLQSQNSRLSNQISNLQGQFSRKQNQLLRQKRTTQKQNRELQFQLEKTREDSSWKQRKYQDTITHLQKENKSLASQLNNYQKQVLIIKNSNSNQLLQLKKINLKLQYQSQQKTKSLTNLHDQIKKLENQLKFAGNQIIRLQCQIKQILSSQSRLKQQIGNLKTRIKEAEREKESECVKSIKIIDQQKLLLSNFSKQLEQLTVRAHNKNEQLISVKKINTVNKIETQSQNIDTHFQCKQRMRENQDMINLLKWTNQQYKKTNYQLQKDNQHKQHKILSLLDVKDTISNRLHIAQQQLQKRQTSIKLYERKIQQCNLETYKYEHIKGQKQKLQAQVKQKDKQISQLQKKNRNLLMQKNTHLEEIQKLTYQMGCATKNKDKISILRSGQKSRALLLSMQKSLEMKNKFRKERDTSDINMGQLKQFESIQVQQQSRNKFQRVLEMLRNKRNQDRSSECSLNSSGSQEPKQMDWIVEEKDDEEEAKELLILSQGIEKLIDYKIKLEKQLKRALKQRQAVRISLIREIEEGVDNIIMYIYQNGIINSSYQIHKFRFEETTNSFGSISPMSVPETFPCYLQKYFCKLFNLIFSRNRISSNSSPQCYKSKQKS